VKKVRIFNQVIKRSHLAYY